MSSAGTCIIWWLDRRGIARKPKIHTSEQAQIFLDYRLDYALGTLVLLDDFNAHQSHHLLGLHQWQKARRDEWFWGGHGREKSRQGLIRCIMMVPKVFYGMIVSNWGPTMGLAIQYMGQHEVWDGLWWWTERRHKENDRQSTPSPERSF